VESKDPNSVFNWYKNLIALRRANPALHDGSMTMLDTANQKVLAWTRTAPTGEVVVVACSFSAEPQVIGLESALGAGKSATVIAVNGASAASVSLKAISLSPYGSIVAQIK
jgi:alpha-glucosidase